MSRKDLCVIRKRQELVLDTPVHYLCELLWRMSGRKVRPAHVTDEERISCEDVAGPLRLTAVIHQNADAFQRMAGSLQEPEAALSELDFSPSFTAL